MKLYRFVGESEVFKLLTNEIIVNNRDWSEYCDTNSKGICFFAYNRTNNIKKIVETVLDDWGLSGIVKEFALVEIEVSEARKAWGFYSGGKKTEYNLDKYSIENVTAIYRIHNEDKEIYLYNKTHYWQKEYTNNIGYTVKKVF